MQQLKDRAQSYRKITHDPAGNQPRFKNYGIPDFSAVWLTRDQFDLTFLDQLGLMDLSDLLELSKGLSKIGAKIFEGLWLK